MAIARGGKPIDTIFQNYSTEIRNILSEMLNMDPEKRLSAQTLLKKKIFDSVRNAKQE